DMGKNAFGRLTVGLSTIDTAAIGAADGDRRPPFAAGSIAKPRGFGDQLVSGGIDIVRELDFDDGALAIGAHSDRSGDDAALGDWGIEHARHAIFRLKARRGAKHAAEIS